MKIEPRFSNDHPPSLVPTGCSNDRINQRLACSGTSSATTRSGIGKLKGDVSSRGYSQLREAAEEFDALAKEVLVRMGFGQARD
jgi:hypothetical protein